MRFGIQVVGCALVLLCTCWTYAPLLRHERAFVAYDDRFNYEEQSWALTSTKLRWIWAEGVVLGVYEPVALCAKCLIFAANGGVASATVLARAAFILHAVNAIGTFLLLGNGLSALADFRARESSAMRWHTQAFLAVGVALVRK